MVHPAPRLVIRCVLASITLVGAAVGARAENPTFLEGLWPSGTDKLANRRPWQPLSALENVAHFGSGEGVITDNGYGEYSRRCVAVMQSFWPEINVWSDAAPLLTADFGRLAPDAGVGAGLRPDGDKHVAKSSADLEWAALNSKIAVRDRDTRLDPSRVSTWETDETLKLPVAG